MDTWKCAECGYTHQGEDPPRLCPECGALSLAFDLLEDEPEAWDDDWDDEEWEEDWEDEDEFEDDFDLDWDD